MMLNRITYVIVILSIFCTCRGQCLPIGMTPPETMTRSLFIFKKFLSATEAFEEIAKSQDVIQVLKDFNNMVTQLVEVNKQLSNGIEGSGASTLQIHVKELQATQSFLKASIQQACEWVKRDLFANQEITDCSNESDSHDLLNRAQLYATIIGVVQTTSDSVDNLGGDDSHITETSCLWFYCTFNPECKGTMPVSTLNYEFMKNTVKGSCRRKLDFTTMTCDSCTL